LVDPVVTSLFLTCPSAMDVGVGTKQRGAAKKVTFLTCLGASFAQCKAVGLRGMAAKGRDYWQKVAEEVADSARQQKVSEFGHVPSRQSRRWAVGDLSHKEGKGRQR
jgi:hypothetical protein